MNMIRYYYPVGTWINIQCLPLSRGHPVGHLKEASRCTCHNYEKVVPKHCPAAYILVLCQPSLSDSTAKAHDDIDVIDVLNSFPVSPISRSKYSTAAVFWISQQHAICHWHIENPWHVTAIFICQNHATHTSILGLRAVVFPEKHTGHHRWRRTMKFCSSTKLTISFLVWFMIRPTRLNSSYYYGLPPISLVCTS